MPNSTYICNVISYSSGQLTSELVDDRDEFSQVFMKNLENLHSSYLLVCRLHEPDGRLFVLISDTEISR